MKVQISKLVALAFLFVTTDARSQTLDWASLTGSQIVDSQGVDLDNTYVFELGAFDVDFTPDQSNLADWAANWHVFDTAAYSYTPQDGGYFTGTRDAQDVPAYTSLFQGLTAYIWIRNAANSEYFLASATGKPGVDPWTFPTLDPGCCPNGEVTTWSVSDLNGDTPVWGSHFDEHGGGDYDAPGPFDIQTHAVPEAGVPLFALFSCCTVLLRRRRSK